MATSFVNRLKERASLIFLNQEPEESGDSETANDTQPAPALETYKLYLDLYKFYLDLAVKLVTVYYAALGLFLTYFFSRFDPTDKRASWLLVLPILFGFVLGEFFDRLYHKSEIFHKEASKLKKSLKIEFGPEAMFWKTSIRISIFLFFVPSLILLLFLIARLAR
jgi:hypothetical protein